MNFAWFITFVIYIAVIIVPIFLLLGLAFLAAFFCEWINIVREREAFERCLRLHGSPTKGKVDELL